MIGMDATTGKQLDGMAHLRQSITDILITPIGSRVMRRDYGSDLFSLVDAPMNDSGVMDVYEAVVTALARWEPRFTVTHVRVTPRVSELTLEIDGTAQPSGTPLHMDNIKVSTS